MATEPKYKSIIELADAFKSGELNREHYMLILDNDSSRIRYVGPLPDGIASGSPAADAFDNQKYDECSGLFRGNGYMDLQEACEAAGIPSEWC